MKQSHKALKQVLNEPVNEALNRVFLDCAAK